MQARYMYVSGPSSGHKASHPCQSFTGGGISLQAVAAEGSDRRGNLAPAGGKDIFQKFAGAAVNSKATMNLPLPPGRTDTTLHSAFSLLLSFTRNRACPTGTGTSSTVTPPWPLTHRERVRILNLWFCSLIPWTIKSAKTETRGVRRRSTRRKWSVDIADGSSAFYDLEVPDTGPLMVPGPNRSPVQLAGITAGSTKNDLSHPQRKWVVGTNLKFAKPVPSNQRLWGTFDAA